MQDPQDDTAPLAPDAPGEAPERETAKLADAELSEAEARTRNLPARFANRLYAAPDGHNVRLVFGERIQDETIFHSSLIVSAGDGLLMARLIAEIAGATVDWQIEKAADHLEALKDLRSDR